MRSIPLHKLLDSVGIVYQSALVNPEITDISFSSKDVSKGYLFLGLPGSKVDGGVYWQDALKNGADAVIITAATKKSGPVNQAIELSRFRGKIVVVGATDIHPERNELWKKEV